jgi:hypothetical protein
MFCSSSARSFDDINAARCAGGRVEAAAPLESAKSARADPRSQKICKKARKSRDGGLVFWGLAISIGF